MYKLAALVVAAFLLFSLLAVHDASARPLQEISPDTSSNHEIEFNKLSQVEEAVVGGEDQCEGLSGDECLMRRSLAAHVDYIYTQKNNKP